MKKYLLLLIGLLISTILFAQINIDEYHGGPYTPDANTILLYHFDGNLTNSSTLTGDGIPNGNGISYSSTLSHLGQSLSIDNSSQTNISVPHSSNLSLSGDWTIEMWFKITSLNAGLINKPANNGWANYNIHVESPDGHMEARFYDVNGNRYQINTPSGTIEINTWYHVAFINNTQTNSIKLLVRDEAYTSIFEQSLSYPAETIPINSNYNVTIGESVTGFIDELRISNICRNYSLTYEYDWLTSSSEYFDYYYTNTTLLTEGLKTALHDKLDDLDNTILEVWDGIDSLDRSEKIKVYLYEANQPFVSAPADLRDWDIGYYKRFENELHIRIPSTVRQLKYFANLKKAALSVLARYVMGKKYAEFHSGQEPIDGISFGFGLYESGYSPDLTLIQNYLDANANTMPNRSAISTWAQLEDETITELAFSFVFASIFRFGYLSPTIHSGMYNSQKDMWYQIIRIFFLTDIENGGMFKFYEEEDYIIYSNDQAVANLAAEGLQWYANQFEESFGARINHPLLVTIYGSEETYTYTQRGNIDEVGGGGEACSHSLLRTSPPYTDPNLSTEVNNLLIKYSGLMGHEFMHNTFASLAITEPPSWLNEGSAMYADIFNLQGNNDVDVSDFDYFHNFFWNDNGIYFPDLDKIFDMNGNFGYQMSYSSFGFIKDNFSKETLIQFMKRSDDISTIGYSNIDEFQRHLYETLYHQYMPDFLFNPNWDIETTFSPGANFTFNWDGHYIDNLVLEYSLDGATSWTHIAEVSFSTGSYTWAIPNSANCVLRFSDKDFLEINFTFQILGDKPTFGKVLQMTFENGAANNILDGNNGRLKGDVSFESRGGQNGNYVKFDGVWDVLSVQNYQNLSLNENWTIQCDFMIKNTSGVMNDKPVLLEKHSSDHGSKNYYISFNDNGQNHLYFEYKLENNNTVKLEIDNAGITLGNWYTYYFARSVENNIVEARVYDQSGNLLDNDTRQLNGEGKVSTGNGDLYFGVGFFFDGKYLQGGLDNIIISDTYYPELMLNTVNASPVISDIPDQAIDINEDFATINLDNYVSDADHADSELLWTVSGNVELIIDIDQNRVATVSTPNSNWYGADTVIFTVTDPLGAYVNDNSIFTVNTPEGPTASFTSNSTTGILPLLVGFTDQSTQGIGTITQWSWDFGDGSTSTIQNPSYSFNEVGSYTVSLTVQDSYGLSDTKTRTNYIRVYVLPAEPSNPQPENQANEVSIQSGLSWIIDENTENVDLYFGTENPPTNKVLNDILAVTSYNSLALSYQTNYFWKVVCRNGDGSTEGPVWSFTTAIGTGISDNPEDDKLVSMYPNPTHNMVIISSPVVVDLSIINILGQVIFEKKDFLQGEINVTSFNKGIYLVMFTSKTGRVSRKLIIE